MAAAAIPPAACTARSHHSVVHLPPEVIDCVALVAPKPMHPVNRRCRDVVRRTVRSLRLQLPQQQDLVAALGPLGLTHLELTRRIAHRSAPWMSYSADAYDGSFVAKLAPLTGLQSLTLHLGGLYGRHLAASGPGDYATVLSALTALTALDIKFCTAGNWSALAALTRLERLHAACVDDRPTLAPSPLASLGPRLRILDVTGMSAVVDWSADVPVLALLTNLEELNASEVGWEVGGERAGHA